MECCADRVRIPESLSLVHFNFKHRGNHLFQHTGPVDYQVLLSTSVDARIVDDK